MTDTQHHAEMANAIRFLTMDAVEKANSGHPGMPMGMADVAAVLFSKFLRFDASAPGWADRDRFILSAGHGSMLIYALNYLVGYEGMSIEDLKQFRQLGSRTPGHPEYGHTVGVETTTGPLGQGIANAVGMALAERMLNARFGDELVDHRTYVIAGDGCLMEGISHEAIGLAAHLKLSKLVVLFDDNQISIDGPTSLAVSEDAVERFKAAGWNATRIDGHDPAAIEAALQAAQTSNAPTLIACRTAIGYGAPTKAGKSSCHGAPLGAEEIAGAREKLGWSAEPFEVPGPILDRWRAAGVRARRQRTEWQRRLDALPAERRAEWEAGQKGELPSGFAEVVANEKARLLADPPKVASRKASQMVLEVLNPAVPSLVGGSADLSGSNLTRSSELQAVTAESFAGRYLHYGVREHGMGAVMNGLALHGGFIPYGGTFLVFSDYCRPAIRMSALMEQRVVYVMTHDSIGLGEDGPTHQPIEHLASFRAMPNVSVMRPADAVETLECWEMALEHAKGPTVLALSRQSLPPLRFAGPDENPRFNRSALGAYLLVEPDGGRDVTLLASGSEVGLAMEAARALSEKGVRAAVASMPCWERFARQSKDYRASVLGKAPRVAIEAGATFGWDRWVGDDGEMIGIDRFGASGPGPEVYETLGLATAQVTAAVLAHLGRA